MSEVTEEMLKSWADYCAHQGHAFIADEMREAMRIKKPAQSIKRSSLSDSHIIKGANLLADTFKQAGHDWPLEGGHWEFVATLYDTMRAADLNIQEPAQAGTVEVPETVLRSWRSEIASTPCTPGIVKIFNEMLAYLPPTSGDTTKGESNE